MPRNLTFAILIGMLLGVAAGFFCHQALGDAGEAERVAGYFSIVSDIFLKMIKMISAPLPEEDNQCGGRMKLVVGDAVTSAWGCEQQMPQPVAPAARADAEWGAADTISSANRPLPGDHAMSAAGANLADTSARARVNPDVYFGRDIKRIISARQARVCPRGRPCSRRSLF